MPFSCLRSPPKLYLSSFSRFQYWQIHTVLWNIWSQGTDKVCVWTCRGIGFSTYIFALEHAQAKISMVEIYFRVFSAAYCTLEFVSFHGACCTPEISRHFLFSHSNIFDLHISHTSASQLEFDKIPSWKVTLSKKFATSPLPPVYPATIWPHTPAWPSVTCRGSACEIVIDYSA